MAARRGDTLLFPTPPVVAAHAAIGGKKEGESPLAAEFDVVCEMTMGLPHVWKGEMPRA